MFGSKLTRANQRDGKGAGLGEKQVVEGRGRFLQFLHKKRIRAEIMCNLNEKNIRKYTCR